MGPYVAARPGGIIEGCNFSSGTRFHVYTDLQRWVRSLSRRGLVWGARVMPSCEGPSLIWKGRALLSARISNTDTRIMSSKSPPLLSSQRESDGRNVVYERIRTTEHHPATRSHMTTECGSRENVCNL